MKDRSIVDELQGFTIVASTGDTARRKISRAPGLTRIPRSQMVLPLTERS